MVKITVWQRLVCSTAAKKWKKPDAGSEVQIATVDSDNVTV